MWSGNEKDPTHFGKSGYRAEDPSVLSGELQTVIGFQGQTVTLDVRHRTPEPESNSQTLLCLRTLGKLAGSRYYLDVWWQAEKGGRICHF